MKKQRVLALLLGLTLLCTAVIPSVFAADGDSSNNGMVINKTATANGDGSYTIQLEAYATGSKIISEVKKDVPTDIVLVLDQSGSMDDPIGTVSFSQYSSRTNAQYYALRHNGGSANLWYQVGEKYYSVSVTVNEKRTYSELRSSLVNYETDWLGNLTTNCYYYYANNLYEDVNGEYKPVLLDRERSGTWFNTTYTYTYTFSDNTSITSQGNSSVPNLGSHLPLYTSESQSVYTYTYTNAEGETITIGTSTGASTTFGTTLYQRVVNTSGGGSRLNALKTAVTTFADSVAQKAAGEDKTLGTDDDVNHRIAVVGFASGKYYDYWDYDYGNTEVFIGSNQYKYGTAAQGAYSSAFQSMNTTAGQTKVTASINALDADGGTLINLGMEMANGILTANPVSSGEKRNRVVIVFTDGQPGWSGYDSDTADAAITQGSTIKDSGATVYTVGVFTGADATSAGNANGTDTQKANWFMQKLSSNNGVVKNPSYYLSAADADTLKNIFQQISDQIESGGSSTTLSSGTVIKDIIAPAFTLPEGANTSDITLETYTCTGKSGDAYTWSKNADAMGATAVIGSTDTANAITTDNQVSVTGFDFADNYVGTVTAADGSVSYRGSKLVIKFTVTPRPGFFGGNGVATNTSAGVYENNSATEPVLTFERPTVDVPLAQPDVTVPDANVYLGAYYSQTVPEDAVKMGATVKIGGYDIDFSKADDPDHPYGLEPWQVEYVNISISASTEGNGGSFENIQEDITYTVTVTVEPKTQGSSGDEMATDAGEGTIHVFKPKLTFKDSNVWYGDDAPSDFSGNLVEETWVNSDGTKKHDDADVQMLNEKPTLDLTYTPETGKIVSGKINTKQDIPVDVTVKIGAADVTSKTTFAHNNCEGKTCTVSGGKFLLHVKTCQLTVTKNGGVEGEPYVFTVKKDGVKYTEVTVVGNGSETICELPVGTYTIQEDTGWSWRFTPSYSNNGVTLGKANPEDTITCTNSTNQKTYWLNGFSDVVKNIFGVKN